jgi:hypothetical protein
MVFEHEANNFEPRVIATKKLGASNWKWPCPMLPAFVGREQSVPSPSSQTRNSTVESSFIFSNSGTHNRTCAFGQFHLSDLRLPGTGRESGAAYGKWIS